MGSIAYRDSGSTPSMLSMGSIGRMRMVSYSFGSMYGKDGKNTNFFKKI